MQTASSTARISLSRRSPREALLLCGVAAATLYVAADVVAAAMYPGYSYVDQQQSELSALGAPTRPFWIAMTAVYTPLVVAFGMGVWLTAKQTRALRATGVLLVAFGVIGCLWVLLAPMHRVGETPPGSDTMHLVFVVIQIAVMVLFISFGAMALGRGLRRLSSIIILVMLVAGGIVGAHAQDVAAATAPPGLGLVERLSVYAPMIWIAAFALSMRRRRATNW